MEVEYSVLRLIMRPVAVGKDDMVVMKVLVIETLFGGAGGTRRLRIRDGFLGVEVKFLINVSAFWPSKVIFSQERDISTFRKLTEISVSNGSETISIMNNS